jgi:hypothetical protein
VPDVPRSLLLTVPVLMSLAHAAPVAAAPCGSENLLAGKQPYALSHVNGNPAQLTDGVVGQEGAQWDAPIVVTLAKGTSTVTFDLGEPRQISALFMQGDANDIYKISGSMDGAEGSFRPLGEFPNVVLTGHGLRSRAVEITPATVRYLQIGNATGDGFFTISELGAYCTKPAEFPVTVIPTLSQPTDVVNEGGWRTFGVLYAIGAAALVWGAYLMRKRLRAA